MGLYRRPFFSARRFGGEEGWVGGGMRGQQVTKAVPATCRKEGQFRG